MADKSLHEFSVLAIANVPVGPNVNVGDKNFKLRIDLITMVRANSFCGSPSSTTRLSIIKDVAPDVVRLQLFPVSLVGKVKQLFYKDQTAINMWNKCATTFLTKFFPIGKTNVLSGRIQNF